MHFSIRSRWTALAAVALVATANCREVDVTAVEAARVEISPADPSVQVGQTIRLSARVLSSEGRELSGHSVAWQSLNPELAQVDGDGDVVGVAVGVASIRASSGTVSATAELSVTPGPAIQLAPPGAEFVGIENGATPGDRTITVSNAGAGTLSGLSTQITHPAGEPTGWLSASLAATVAPTSLVLRADQAGLPPGIYHAAVAVASPVATNAVEVDVTLTVLSPSPAIALGSTNITFAAPEGGADPGQQTVSVTNAGGGTLADLTAVVRYAAGDPTGWLQATIGTTAPATLTLRASLGTLPAGSYEADVHVASSVAQNSPQFVHVTFNVGGALPAIGVAPASLTFAGTSGGSDPATQDVAITNTGGATLSDLGISVVYPGGQPGGWVTQSLDQTSAPATLTVGADVGALAPGTYTATVLVASPVAANSPQEIDVALELAEAAPAIGVSAATASFGTTTHEGDPAPVTIDVSNAGGGTLGGLSATVAYTGGEPTGWLSAALADATAPTTLTLTATKGSLGVGTYTGRVLLASAAATNSPVEVAVTFTISDTPPSAPSGLSAIPQSEKRIDLAWSDNSDNESRFAIERSTSGGTFIEIGTTSSGVTTFVDSTGVAASTAYLYRVRACNAAGCSATSSVSTATSAPGAPSELAASATAPTIVELSWTDNSTDETGFRIERSTDGTSWTLIHTTGSGVTSYDDVTAAPETSYQYRISACRTSLCSSFSNVAAVATSVAVPGAPSGLTASAVSSSRIDLSWSAASGSVEEYRIQRRTGSGGFSALQTVSGTTLSYSNTGLSAGTSYTYQVLACNDSGCSAASNQSSATTLPNAPSAPTDLSATTVSSSRIDLAWSTATGTVGDYRIERALGSGGALDFELIATVDSGTLTYRDDDGLSAGATYTYRVRACNTGGCSAFSSQATATTHSPAPGAPTGLSASAVSATQIHLEWTAPASGGVGEYRIERSATNATGSFGQIATVSGSTTSFENTGLTANEDYFYRVRACNAGGCSAYSGTASAFTNTPPTVSITAPADDASFAAATSVNFAGTATDAADGDVSSSLTWSSSRDGSIGSGASFSIATLSVGTHTITARVTDSHGSSATDAINITIRSNTVPAVAISSPSTGTTVTEGTTVTLSGSATDAEDGDLSASLAWSSSLDGAIGTGASFTRNDLSIGTHTITASVSDSDGNPRSASVTLTVDADAPPTVSITAPADDASFAAGTSVSFVGSATDAVDGDISSSLMWTSSLDGVIGSGASFSTAALSVGTHTITASVTDSHGSSVSDAITLTIRPNTEPEVSISSPADGASFTEGDAVSFTGSASDAEDGDKTASLTWSSDRDGSIGSGGSFSRTDLSVGTHLITASATDADGNTTSETVTITIAANATPLVSITAPGDGTVHIQGTTVTFTGTASDAEDGDVSSALSWSSNLDGALGTGASISTSGLSVGTHSVTASVTDAHGSTAADAITITIRTDTDPEATISSPTDGAHFTEGDAVAFTGSATDAEDGDLTTSLTWSSDRQGSIGSGGSFSRTDLSLGTHVITASVTDADANTTGETVTITIDPLPPGAPAGVTATTVGPTQIDVAWGAATGIVDDYIVARATTSGGPYGDLGTVSASGTTFTFQDTGVSFDADYYYQVRACNVSGCAPGAEASATTRPPGAPSGLDASAAGASLINLDWDAGSGTLTEYAIERKQGSDGTYGEIVRVPAGTLGYSDSGVISETEYFYRVRACSPAGCSDYSNEDSAATEDDGLAAAATAEPRRIALSTR